MDQRIDLDKESPLAKMLRDRAKNLGEHNYLISEIKATAKGLADLAKKLESDPEWGFDAEAVKESISALEQNQRRSRILRTGITSTNLVLKDMDIPVNGI